VRVRARGSRHDPDNFNRHPIERDFSADHLPIAAEPLLPQSVGKHGNLGVARLVFIVIESATENRPHAQQVEKARAHFGAVEAKRIADS
jgi:hypothetical protein